MESNRKTCIVYLKALACVLITNSHCRNIYPLYFFAIGGGFGNSLFFILSGYCLANIKLPFFPWYKKRLKRILSSTCIAILVSILWIDGFSLCYQQGFENTIIFYIHKYWFAFAIALCYIFFFLTFQKKSNEVIKRGLIIYVVVYLLWYIINVRRSYLWIEPAGFAPFKVYFYYGVMILGGTLRLYIDKNGLKSKHKKRRVIIFLGFSFFSFVIWGVVYTLVTVMSMAYRIQIFIHISVLIFSIALLYIGVLLEDEIIATNSKNINSLISLIADTWEIYLVQVTFSEIASFFSFPANWLMFWSMAIGGGILFRKLEKILKL